MNESDRNNPRRLIRAIEIARENPNSKIQIPNKSQIPNFKFENVLFVGLMAPYKVLYERIDKRVEERVKQGVIEEIQKLLKKGYNWENSALGTTIGYREWEKYFRFQASGFRLKEEIIQRWKFAEHAYARRQMTWFKKDKRIHWFDISHKKWQDKIEALVEDWINGKTKNS
jgi:tRNA dimethylallyltransferase